MKSELNLNNKTYLVTGASSGIGKHTATQIALLGGTVMLTGRNEENLKQTANHIFQLSGQQPTYFVLDINDVLLIEEFVDKVSNLDGVVHAAGIDLILPFKKTTPEKFKKILDTNLFSGYNLVWHLVKKKKINHKASIVFLSSVEGNSLSSPAHIAYGVSKAATNAMIKYMALELADAEIRVNGVSPAVVETPMIANWKNALTEEQLLQDQKRYPLKRYGQPQEIADACCFLLSDLSTWTTGTSLIVDGGLSLV